MVKAIATITILLGVTTAAMAGGAGFGATVPEIDPGTAVSALALLSTGLFMVRRRSR